MVNEKAVIAITKTARAAKNRLLFIILLPSIRGKPNGAVTSRRVKAVLAVSKRFVFETTSFLAKSGTMAACGMLQNSSHFQSLKPNYHSTGFETGYVAAHNSSIGFTPIRKTI
jgi:hypothetical protein